MDNTVLSSKKLVDGTVPSCKKLMDGTFSVVNIIEILEISKTVVWHSNLYYTISPSYMHESCECTWEDSGHCTLHNVLFVCHLLFHTTLLNRHITRFCQIRPDTAGYCQILPCSARYCQLLPDTAI